MKLDKRMMSLALVAMMSAPAAFAQEASPVNSGDTAWMLVSTALVLMMTIPGLAMFYGGLVRKKNVVNTLMQCFAATCLATITWYAVSYSLAFSGSGAFIGDLSKVFLKGVDMNSVHPAAGTIPELLFSAFQMTFAIITPALVFGSFVERIKFSAVLLFTVLWQILVYAPVAHMVWGGGYLGSMGALDFAGGTVVHITAGVAGLVAALMLGRRVGFEKKSELFKPHNIGMTLVGASFLWVGWFGFNAGSALAANGKAAIALMNTQVAAAAAATAWMLVEWLTNKKPTAAGITAGAVAGLVAVTPAAGFITPQSALLLGLLAGVFCLVGSTMLKEWLGYDDALDVVGIHGVGGIVGAALTGVFAAAAVGGTAGLIEGNAHQVVVQLIAVGVTIAYTAVVTALILFVLKLTIGLRAEKSKEQQGLDVSEHGEVILG